jgi:hypothetical protein
MGPISRGSRMLVSRRHRPRRRTIQYSAKPVIQIGYTGYWMPRFRGA